MPNPTAMITFNYNNGTPQWSVNRDPLQLPQGPSSIVWQLTPESTAGAAFAPTGGIVFNKPGNTWPGSTPTANGPVYVATDNNTNPGPRPRRYGYSVNVVFNSNTYTWDPDVEEDPPPPPVDVVEPPRNPGPPPGPPSGQPGGQSGGGPPHGNEGPEKK